MLSPTGGAQVAVCELRFWTSALRLLWAARLHCCCRTGGVLGFLGWEFLGGSYSWRADNSHPAVTGQLRVGRSNNAIKRVMRRWRAIPLQATSGAVRRLSFLLSAKLTCMVGT